MHSQFFMKHYYCAWGILHRQFLQKKALHQGTNGSVKFMLKISLDLDQISQND